MNPQPDQLFREKLQHHHMPVPPSVWMRIEKNISRPGPFIYWRLAAAILLLIIAAWLIYRVKFASQQPVLPLTEKTVKMPAEHRIPQQSLTENTYQDVKPVRQEGFNKSKHKSVQAERVEEVMQQQPAIVEKEILNTVAAEQVVVKRNTLVITLAEAQQFIKPEISVADATPDNKKSSRFQKLVELASVIASEEDVLGQLRGRKDELLVRNVRTVWSEQNN
jgi:hypothetical protein